VEFFGIDVLDSYLPSLLIFLFWDSCMVKVKEKQSLLLVLFGLDHFHLHNSLTFNVSFYLFPFWKHSFVVGNNSAPQYNLKTKADHSL
jgi:hypothetical protein